MYRHKKVSFHIIIICEYKNISATILLLLQRVICETKIIYENKELQHTTQ